MKSHTSSFEWITYAFRASLHFPHPCVLLEGRIVLVWGFGGGFFVVWLVGIGLGFGFGLGLLLF